MLIAHAQHILPLYLQKCGNLLRRPRQKTHLETVSRILHRLVQLQIDLMEAREGMLGDLLPVLRGEEQPGGRQ